MATARPEKKEFRVMLTPAEHAWLKGRSGALGQSAQDVLRDMIRREMDGSPSRRDLPAAVGEQKAAILNLLEEHYNIAPAARALGISPARVYAWMNEDQEFAQQAQAAREMRVNTVEDTLLKIAIGSRGTMSKGQITALLAWLNAHHPAYGRIRAEVLARILGPVMDQIMEVAAGYLEQDALGRLRVSLGEVIHRAALRKTGSSRE